MPAPIAPIAWTVLRFGALAATTYYVSRRASMRPKDIWRESALDGVHDGLEVTTDRSEAEANAHTAARFRRTFRMGEGRGVEVDFAALGRFRVRRID
ncbi:hypothetical protein [Algicella marina]|uniref:Uncharacterized protein n=1 Tax=Algicella marina TaxID=2683284 RepID=A0A6P1T5X0_9RHOB|nr:hypothetical protein [Algicella marina]QHQ36689.1 hypothetical protein GO499_16670 [Algicella marina]